MKNIIQLFIPFIISSQLFAIAGLGINLNQTSFSINAKTNSMGQNIGSYGYDEINGGIGGGGYLYIDAIPFIDLDLEFSGFGTKYDYLLTIGDISTNYSLPYGSFSGYFTFQKKVIKLSVPFLAKAKLTVGAGLNSHTYKSVPNQKDIESLIGTGLSSSSTAPTTNKLIDFVKENTDKKSGFHIQTGLQFKLLMLDSFLYYRQVFAKDVILDGESFGSLNLRLGMGI